jgi:serine/threonine protein kinase
VTPEAAPVDDRTVFCPGGVIDSDATIVKPAILRGDPGAVAESNGGRQETSSKQGPVQDVDSYSKTGTLTGTASRSVSSSWGKPEQWLADDSQQVEVGSVIKDRFELIELIGEGGMGMVFKALDRRKVEAQDRHPYLAIKILNEQFKRHPESLKALQREARKAQDLAHPNIVTVFDFDREGSTVFMTMEYMDGESLKDLIRKNANGLPVAQAISLIEGMCHGLSYAHQKGVVHSDFKPGNVMVTRAGLIKIFDFGIARAAKTKTVGDSEGDKTLFDAASLGALTPAYASPEMFLGKDPDPRDDLFALACISYELLSGKHPYDKERADMAQKKGLLPKRLEHLNRLQWKGLSRGLDFDRLARTPSASHFLKEITSKKSKLPVIVGSSSAALMILALIFNKQISSGLNQYDIYNFKNKINSSLESEKDENLTTVLLNLRNTDDDNKKIFYRNDIMPVIVKNYSQRAKKYIDPEHNKYNYQKAITLLKEAQLLYAEDAETAKELNKLIDEFKSEQSKIIGDLRGRFEKLIGEGKILPTRNEENVFNVLERVALIDPEEPLLTDSRLIAAYEREANKALEKNDLDRAKEFIKTGLDVSDSNAQLNELNDKLSIRLREKDVKSEIVRLEEVVGNRLNSVQSMKDLGSMGDDLKKLQELRPDHALLSKAEKIGLDILDRELKVAITSYDWHAGDGLLKELASLNLLDNETMQSRYDQLTAAKGKREGAVEALFDKANKAIADGKPDGAIATISEIKSLAPDDVRIQRLSAKLVQAYLQLANAAKDNHQWDAARNTLDLALKQDIDEAMKISLLKEKETVALAEESYGRQVKEEGKQKNEQEIAQKEKDRQAELLALYNHFDSELKTLERSEKGVNKVLEILDTIEIKSPGDPFVGAGRKKFEEGFLKEAESVRDSASFDQAIKVLKVGIKALPDSQLLGTAVKDFEQQRDSKKIQEQEAKIAGLYEEVDKLIVSALLTKDWEVKLQKLIGNISSQANGQDAKLQDVKKKISILYLNQAQKFRAEQQFTKANESLDKGDRFEKGNEALAKERQLVADDEKASKEKAINQQKLAEMEGLKQSLRTYAQANEVDKARETFSRLKKELSADDPFLTKDAPQSIAIAYLRLAEKKAGPKDNSDSLNAALELVKSGLELDNNSISLKEALADYNKAIKKIAGGPSPEIEGLKQSIKTTAQANEVDQARDALSRLKKKVTANDPFLTKEAPQLIAGAYLRLAEKKAGSKDNIDNLNAAVELVKSGLVLDGSVVGLNEALANYNKAIADLKKPAAPTPTPTPTPVPAQTVTTIPPPTTTPTPVAQTPPTTSPGTSAGGKPCTSSLAGLGVNVRAVCYDMLSDQNKGPYMVVVPAGGGSSKPFAIGKYEISFRDYDLFCQGTGKSSPKTSEESTAPAVRISYQDAQAYAKWLTEKTGNTYRIPKEDEWVYASEAGGKKPVTDYNCFLQQGSVVLKGSSLLSVNSGGANDWGVQNFLGNVQEYVDASGSVKVRGGSYKDSMSACTISLVKNSAGAADELTGFRLVREIKE